MWTRAILLAALLLAPLAFAQAPSRDETPDLPRVTVTGSAIVMENDEVAIRFPSPTPRFTLTLKENATAAATGRVPFTLALEGLVEYRDVDGDGRFSPESDESVRRLNFSSVRWTPSPGTTLEDGRGLAVFGLAHEAPTTGETGGNVANVTITFILSANSTTIPVAGMTSPGVPLGAEEVAVRVSVLRWTYAAAGHRLALLVAPAPDARLTAAEIAPVAEGDQAWVSTEDTTATGLGFVRVFPDAYAMRPPAGQVPVAGSLGTYPVSARFVAPGGGDPVLVMSYAPPDAQLVSHTFVVGPHGRIGAPQEAGGVPLEGAPVWLVIVIAAGLLAFFLARRGRMGGPEGPNE